MNIMPNIKLPKIKLPNIDISSLINMGRGSAHILGVDIGSRALKIVGIRLGQNPALQFYSISEIAQSAIAADAAHISEMIKKAVKDNNFPSQDVVLAFTDEAVAIRRMELPHMPLREASDALKWKAKELVHFDITGAAIDFEVLGEIEKEDGSKAMEIIFTAISNEAIDKRVKIIKNAGLAVAAVSVHPFGIENLLRASQKTDTGRTILVADCGWSKTEVSFYKNNRLEFVRSIPFGAGSVNESLQVKFLNDTGEEKVLTTDEAESAKRQVGIAYEVRTLDNGMSSRQFLSMMRPVLERLSKEIKRSIEYYIHEFSQEGIALAFLVGGGGALKNMDKYLCEELNIPVSKMALPDTIDVSGVKLNADEAMSIVSLAGMTAFYRKAINLLPHEYRQEKAEFIEKVSLRALASVLIVVLWVSFFFTKVKIDDYERRIKTAPYQLDAVNQIKELRARVLERESFMSSIQASEVQMEYIMKELSNIVPSNVVFDELVINKKAKTLDIKGIFYGPNSSAQTVLAKFMEEIERSKYFKEAQLASLHAAASAGRETSNFSINCLLE